MSELFFLNSMKIQIVKIYALIILLTWPFLSCERYDPVNVGEVDCSNCFNPRPEWVPLSIKVTINDQNPYVPFTIYIGNFEDGNIDWVDTASNADFHVDVHPDQYYSVKAEYKDGSNIIFAIDGDKIKMNYSENSCNEPCYYATGGYIDVQLKN